MKFDNKLNKFSIIIVGIALMMMACSLFSGADSESAPAATPTPTPAMIPGNITDIPQSISRCGGLSGVFEVQLLVGPSEAVGLEPYAIGEIPFSVVTAEKPFIIEGANSITYDDVLKEEWGTYTVSFNMDFTLTGECSGEAGTEQLMVDVTMSGDQLVEVDAGEFQGEYPWSGTQEKALNFPLQKGATARGEGWQLVLHMN